MSKSHIFETPTDAEGLDQEEEADNEKDAIDTPFDPTHVEITAKKFTISALLERLKHDELSLSPDFQRRANLWDNKRKSRLIESILLRIPLPSFYFREDEKGNFLVVDGLQRLCSIFHFVNHEELNRSTKVAVSLGPLKLEGLQYLKTMEGRAFSDLERAYQRRINELEIEANVIRPSTPQAVMFNVFARLNQGGLPLSPQEIRNAIYPGNWRENIRNLAESKEFTSATGSRIPKDRQQDMEMILRFVALWAQTPRGQRKSNQILDKFLNDSVENTLNTWNTKDWKKAETALYSSLLKAIEIFGQHAFRKSSELQAKQPVNKGLFEAQLIALSMLKPTELLRLIHAKTKVTKEFGKQINDKESRLSKALRSGTGHAESSNARIEELTKIFKLILK